MKYDAMIVRRADDDFRALEIAHAMQSIDGVEVVSVVCQPTSAHGAMVWHVFAKFDSESVTINAIDESIVQVLA